MHKVAIVYISRSDTQAWSLWLLTKRCHPSLLYSAISFRPSRLCAHKRSLHSYMVCLPCFWPINILGQNSIAWRHTVNCSTNCEQCAMSNKSPSALCPEPERRSRKVPEPFKLLNHSPNREDLTHVWPKQLCFLKLQKKVYLITGGRVCVFFAPLLHGYYSAFRVPGPACVQHQEHSPLSVSACMTSPVLGQLKPCCREGRSMFMENRLTACAL